MLATWDSISVCSGPLPQAQYQQLVKTLHKKRKFWRPESALLYRSYLVTCSCVKWHLKIFQLWIHKLCSKLLIILIMQCSPCDETPRMQCSPCDETPRIKSKKMREAKTGSQRQTVPSVAILGHSSYIPNLIVIDSLTTCELHQLM